MRILWGQFEEVTRQNLGHALNVCLLGDCWTVVFCEAVHEVCGAVRCAQAEELLPVGGSSLAVGAATGQEFLKEHDAT